MSLGFSYSSPNWHSGASSQIGFLIDENDKENVAMVFFVVFVGTSGSSVCAPEWM